jgi:hypothetical protein
MDVEPRTLREVHGFVAEPEREAPKVDEKNRGGQVRDGKIE